MRHGLNLVNRQNPAFAPEIEEIAKNLCGKNQDPLLYEQALEVAECDLILMRARSYAVALTERLVDPNSLPTTKRRSEWKHRSDAVEWEMEEYEAIRASYRLPGEPQNSAPGELDLLYAAFWRTPKDRDDCDAFCEALPDLSRVACYERRAWSRRRRAFCEFLAIKSQCGASRAHHPNSVDRENDLQRPPKIG